MIEMLVRVGQGRVSPGEYSIPEEDIGSAQNDQARRGDLQCTMRDSFTDEAELTFGLHGVSPQVKVSADGWLICDITLSGEPPSGGFSLCEPHRSQLSHSSNGKQGGVG
jgi:hypothetical protein